MKIILLMLAALILSSPANAREKWDFGRIDYGTKVKTAPTGVKGWSCDDEGGCGFKDDMGVEYYSWDDEVVIKKAVVGVANIKQLFGLQPNLDMRPVLARMSQKTGLNFQCDTHETNSNIEKGLHICDAAVIPGDPGVWLILTFGADLKLREIEIFTHYI